ncbi:hypothetical protein [Vibrio sinaloensis]|uniref:hypothetical protein n=1 Tax=Photobacterium sp. (strain ATCC 43367) TaxID=379097 RepID=UPI00058029DE|nr:hypothetical protein [Vibrio sinaloensis]KHT48592.1 hypothetical protein RJ46_10325 [Vibrio sinaloensis]
MRKVYIHAYSYEPRAKETLDRVLSNEQIDSVISIDYLGVSEELTNKYRTIKNRCNRIIKNRNKSHHVVTCYSSSQNDFINGIKSIILDDWAIVLDSSCFTGMHLLRLLKDFEGRIESVYYTSSHVYRYTDPSKNTDLTFDEKCDDELTSVLGYNGINYNGSPTLLIIISGYQGNRSYLSYSILNSDLCVSIIGVPWTEPNLAIEAINRAMKENESISVNNMNMQELAPNYCSKSFCSRLRDIVRDYKNVLLENKKDDKCNVIVVPLGTKLQTIGLYFYCTKYPDTQVYYPVSKSSSFSSQEVGETYKVNLREFVSE